MWSRLSLTSSLLLVGVLLVAFGLGSNAFDPREGGRGFVPKRESFQEQSIEIDDLDADDNNCTLEVDLVIAIDGSNSITDSDWQSALSFLYDVVLGFELGPNAAQIGVVQFSYGTVVVPLTFSVSELQEGLENMTKLDQGTNIAQGIITSQDQINEHGRSGVPHVIMVLTDGQQYDPYSPLNPVTAAGNAKLDGIIMFGIGVGDHVDVTTMHEIVNSPWQDYYFPVSGYDNLTSILQKTVLSVCHPSTTTASSSSGATSSNTQSSQTSTTQSSQSSTGGSNSQSSQSSTGGGSNSQSSQSSTGGGSNSQSSQSSQSSTGGGSNSQSSQSSQSSTGGGSNSQSSQSSQSSSQSTSGGTGGGTKCGNFNTCAMGDFCCSDGNNPNDPFYCCAGSNRCCEGACCRQGYQCYNGQCIGGVF